MNRSPLTAVAVLATLALGAPVSAQSPAAETAAAKTWIGHYAELEEVTKPQRAFFAPAGTVESVTFKHLPMGAAGASGRPTRPRSRRTSSTGCSDSTWCRSRSGAGSAASSRRRRCGSRAAA